MIEQGYYAAVNRKARWEVLRDDPSFREALLSGSPHVGVFSDHGVVHVRDVARQALAVLSQVHGLLIPRRSPARLTPLRGLGVTLAYIHDVGKSNFSPWAVPCIRNLRLYASSIHGRMTPWRLSGKRTAVGWPVGWRLWRLPGR